MRRSLYARELLDQGQKQTALAILRNARSLDPQSKEIAALIARAEITKEPPARWVSLPHQVIVQGVEMAAESAYINAAAEGWNRALSTTLEKDEIWFVVEGTAYAQEGGPSAPFPGGRSCASSRARGNRSLRRTISGRDPPVRPAPWSTSPRSPPPRHPLKITRTGA